MNRPALFATAALLATLSPTDAWAGGGGEPHCMVCEEAIINGELYHGFWEDSGWLCEGGGGNSISAFGEFGSCRACGFESDCHTIHEPTPTDPYGGFEEGPCHEGCYGGGGGESIALIESWLEVPATNVNGAPILVLMPGDPVGFDPGTGLLTVRNCDGEVIKQWAVPQDRNQLILTHAL